MHDYIRLIENPIPDDWRDLQTGVRNILRDIGYKAEQEHTVKTPRGTVELDVYATDDTNDHKITIVSECKNWNNRVNQAVVHSFMTVMAEVGANIGYIISKNGFQSGALEYAKNTNITCLTYEEFQNKYIETWIDKYFFRSIGIYAYLLYKYYDPMSRVDPYMKAEHFDLIPYSLKCVYKLLPVILARKGHDEYGIASEDMFMNSLYAFSPSIFGNSDLYLRDIVNNTLPLLEPIVSSLNAAFGENMVLRLYGHELIGIRPNQPPQQPLYR